MELDEVIPKKFNSLTERRLGELKTQHSAKSVKQNRDPPKRDFMLSMGQIGSATLQVKVWEDKKFKMIKLQKHTSEYSNS